MTKFIEKYSNNYTIQHMHHQHIHHGGTTTEQAFGPSHLSRLPLDPRPKSALVPGPTASRGSVGGQGPFVPFGVTNRDQRPQPGTNCPGWSHQPGQMGGFGSSWIHQSGQKAPTYIPFLPPPPEPFSSVFLLFLARVGGVLAHFLHDL